MDDHELRTILNNIRGQQVQILNQINQLKGLLATYRNHEMVVKQELGALTALIRDGSSEGLADVA